MEIFSWSESLANSVMLEAHNNGYAVTGEYNLYECNILYILLMLQWYNIICMCCIIFFICSVTYLIIHTYNR